MEEKKKLGLLSFLAVLAVAGWLVKSFYLDNPTLITVAGQGKVSVKPQMVKFTTTIMNASGSSTQAVIENQRLVQEIVSVLKSNGAEEGDIDIAYFRLLTPQTTGLANYQAVNSIQTTLKDVSKFDNLVIQLYAGGAMSVSNIVFTTQDAQELEKKAISLAINEAKQRGKELAKASGKRLGKMVSIATDEVGEAGAISGLARESNLQGAVMASPSQIEIARQASIIFELR